MLKYWLSLLKSPSISLSRRRSLVCHFGTPRSLFQATDEELLESELLATKDLHHIKTFDVNSMKTEMDIMQQTGCGFIPFNSDEFPDLLNEIPSPPLGFILSG